MGEIISPFDSCAADKERENFAHLHRRNRLTRALDEALIVALGHFHRKDTKIPADQTNDDVLSHDGVRVSSSSVSSSVSNGEENIDESRTGSIGEFLDQLENVSSFANSRGSASRTCVKYPRPYTSSKRRLFLNPKLTIPNKTPPNRPHSPVSRAVSSSGLQASNRVRTLYECVADCRCQLSFMPGQILTNVSKSKEPGWLVGTLNGKPGLVPENFVEPLP
ncbi:putative SH3 domain protein [Trichinella nativa]|uniref:Putative SH3 domain protein n=1 Tax=Trichinella nativa TaxID=6335 RepID=A0A1Y3E6Q4_9BILA|nr:putative SH3 domain protein [Trichinella nativa]